MTRLSSELVVSLIDKVTAPARSVAGAVGQLREAQARNAREMQAARGAMVDAIGMGYALAQSVGAPVRAAMAFEEAMADVRKVVDFPTPKAFQAMSQDIIAMSTRIPMAAKDIASIVAEAGQAGMQGGELLSFAEMAAKVGVAFDMSAGAVGESLAKIKTALGLTVGETGALSDAINHLSNTSASAAPDLVDFMHRVGAAGELYGFTAEQTAAIGSAMIAAGAEANVAATSFRNVGRALARGESASKRQDGAYRRLGLSATDVAKRLQHDAVGTLNDVLARLRALPKELQASTMTDLFGDEARAIAPLVGNAALLEDALKSVEQQANFLGSTQEEYNRRAETTANKMQLFRNQVTALGIAIGEALLPPITQFLDMAGPIVGRVTAFAAANKALTMTVVSLAAGLVGLRVATLGARYAFLFMKGGVLDIAMAGARAAGAIVGVAKKIKLAVVGAAMLSAVGGGGIMAGLVSGLTAAAGAAVALAAPLAVVGLAVAGVALAVYRYWEPISHFLSGFAEGIWQSLGPLVGRLRSWGGEMAEAVGEWATNRLVDLGRWLGIDEATIREAIDGVVAAVRSIPGLVGDWIGDLFSMKDYSAKAESEFRNAGLLAGQALATAMTDAAAWIIDWFLALPRKIIAAIGTIDLSGIIRWPSLPSWMRGDGIAAVPAAAAAPAMAGARRAGGAIVGGRSYLVGEEGPELVTPSRSGHVHDAGATERMLGGDRYVSISFGDVIVQGVQDAEAVAAEIEDRIRDKLDGLQSDMEWSIA